MASTWAIFFSSRRRHTRYIGDWSSDVCSSDLDILDTSGRVIELKTASKKPQGISASHYLQVVTYAILTAPAQPPQDPDWPTPRSGPGARLDTLTKTHAPGYYSHSLTVDDDAARYAESIYPMVAEAIGDGLYLPRRSSN